MRGPIHELSVEIVRFVSDDQPGWVESELEDAAGRRHTIRDKVPIFTCESLDAASHYPQPGVVRCRVLERWTDGDGREVARIHTGWPDGVESTEAVLEFVVLSTQVVPSTDAPGGLRGGPRPSPSGKRSRWGAHAARAILELVVALFFLAYAAETLTHRAFSNDPRVKVILSAWAALAATLGILPILFHLSPRLGRLGLFIWLASLLLLLVVGSVTKG